MSAADKIEDKIRYARLQGTRWQLRARLRYPCGTSARGRRRLPRCSLLRLGERGGRVGLAYKEEVDLLPVRARARRLAALVHQRRAEGSLEGREAIDLGCAGEAETKAAHGDDHLGAAWRVGVVVVPEGRLVRGRGRVRIEIRVRLRVRVRLSVRVSQG